MDNSKKDIKLLIDDNVIANINSNALKFGFSYEYAFEAFDKCLIIVFTPNAKPKLAIDGVYIDNGRPYAKVHKPSFLSIALYILTFIMFLSGIIFFMINKRYLFPYSFFLLCIVGIGYLIRLFSNYPVQCKRYALPGFVVELTRSLIMIGIFILAILFFLEIAL